MRRRGLKPSPLLLLAPAYFILLSVAAWLALWEWTLKPFVWNKTDHVPHEVEDNDGVIVEARRALSRVP